MIGKMDASLRNRRSLITAAAEKICRLQETESDQFCGDDAEECRHEDTKGLWYSSSRNKFSLSRVIRKSAGSHGPYHIFPLSR